MDFGQSFISTFVPSVVAIIVIVIFAAVLSTRSIGAKLYEFLMRRKRIVLVFLAFLILTMPAFFSLGMGRSLSFQEIALYIREILLSVILIVSFAATWKLLHSSTSIRRWFDNIILHYITHHNTESTHYTEAVSQHREDISADSQASLAVSNQAVPGPSRRVASNCANMTAHAQSGGGTLNYAPPLPKLNRPTSSRFSSAPQSVVGMYEAPQLLATQNSSAHQEDAPLLERAVGEPPSPPTSKRQSPISHTNSNVSDHRNNSSDKHRKN